MTNNLLILVMVTFLIAPLTYFAAKKDREKCQLDSIRYTISSLHSVRVDDPSNAA